MNKKALLALCVAVLVPLVSYFIVKKASDNAVVMPRRYYYDSVTTVMKDGKQLTDTLWHPMADFRLINQLGDTVSLSQLKGRVIVADFFFTHCASICPYLTRNMKKLQDALKLKDDLKRIDTSFVQFLSFSVDPEHDSAEALRKYADKYGVNSDVWWLLTGPKKTIYDQALNEFKLGLQDSVSVDSDFVHTSYLTLLDKDHVVRGYYNGLDTTSLSKLAEDIVFIMLEKDKKAPSELNGLKPLLPLFLVVFAVTILGVWYFSRNFSPGRIPTRHREGGQENDSISQKK